MLRNLAKANAPAMVNKSPGTVSTSTIADPDALAFVHANMCRYTLFSISGNAV